MRCKQLTAAVILKSASQASPAKTKTCFPVPNVSQCKFPAAGNLAANFFSRSPEFCKFCPKSADSTPYAGKGAGIPGNLPVNRFCWHDLRVTLSASPGAQQGNGRECQPRLWRALLPQGLRCPNRH